MLSAINFSYVNQTSSDNLYTTAKSNVLASPPIKLPYALNYLVGIIMQTNELYALAKWFEKQIEIKLIVS